MGFASVISKWASQSLVLPAALIFGSVWVNAGPVPNGAYRATAYAQSGVTASGETTHRHVVAADPDILPLGSRIKIRRAGKYSGEYVVADTGSKIQGRRLDIYMPSEQACKKFGTKVVRVKVIQLGNGTQAATKQADQAVKRDVDKEVQKQAVGSAATTEDWAKARAEGKISTTPNRTPPRP
ncbi:MAG: 3D domain-containing protein [Bryobacteraceae bacterium]